MKRRNFVKSVIGGASLTIVPTTLFGFSKKRSKLKIDKEGNKRWYLNGKLHREDGPAIEYSDGTKFWWSNGILHRIDGPAMEFSNGDKLWYFNDQLHRINGPACEYANGYKQWFLNGEYQKSS